MANEHLTVDPDEDNVPLMKSPVVRVKSFPKESPSPADGQGGNPNLESLGWRESDDDHPEFEKHAEATNIEVFYDLFFAAILCVFAEVQDVTNLQQLNSFIAYFVLLWLGNWALLGLFDVRFITDSIFERSIRAVHFGVMVGFAVVAPTWSLYENKSQTYRTLSLILMASRLAMASQYGSIMWHIRRFKKTRLPMGMMVALNLVSAIIYLGVAFAFKDGTDSKLYAIWFIMIGLETLITIVLSLKFQVLSFSGTHIVSRMSLLSYIFMGEGIITVLSAVTKVVINHNSWTSATIGNVAAGISNLYLIYMTYFDWRRNLRMPLYRELLWSFLHFPFHLFLKLFILGSSQFVIWWKVIETYLSTNKMFMTALKAGDNPGFNVTTSWFVSTINGTLNEVFQLYRPKYDVTPQSISDGLALLMEIPDDFWATVQDVPEEEFLNNETVSHIINALAELLTAMQNSLFATFNVNGYSAFEGSEEVFKNAAELEERVWELNWGKFKLVFTYAYVAAGLTLITMNLLYIVSRNGGWTPFNYVRKGLNFLIGVGLCLVTLITLNTEQVLQLWGTPWPLPILVITLFVVLILNHLPQPPPIFFNGANTKRLGGDKRKKQKTGWGVVRQMGFRTGAAPAEKDTGYPGAGSAHPQEGYQAPAPGYQQQDSPVVSEQQRQYEQQYLQQQQQQQQQVYSQQQPQYHEADIAGYLERQQYHQGYQQHHQQQQGQGYGQAPYQQGY